MRIDYIEGSEYWTAESLDDLMGWELVGEERWTEAVSRLHCRRNLDSATVEFRTIYCRTSILKDVTEVTTVQ